MTTLPKNLVPEMKEFALLKSQIDSLTKRQAVLKKDLMSALEKYGEGDEDGHLYLDLPSKGIGGYVRLQRQRRVSQQVDEDTAAAILKAHDLAKECYRMVPVLDEDAIHAAFYRGLLSQEDLDEMFPKKITYAFCPLKT